MDAPAWLDELALHPGPPWHDMGTRSLDVDDWLVVDVEREAQLAEKRRLIDQRGDDVIARLPSPEVAAAENEAARLLALESGFQIHDRRPPLVAAALVVQEDLCVLLRRAGEWRLESGVVCFPSMWRLADKIGQPLAAVHGPVPAYGDELATRVDRFLDRLRADRPVRRRNWLIHESPELHLPAPPVPQAEEPEVPGGLWLRSERQTLRLLPSTGAVLFTIRTQQVPLAVVGDRPEIAAGMAAAVRSWSPELVAYRGASRWRPAALRWLGSLAP